MKAMPFKMITSLSIIYLTAHKGRCTVQPDRCLARQDKLQGKPPKISSVTATPHRHSKESRKALRRFLPFCPLVRVKSQSHEYAKKCCALSGVSFAVTGDSWERVAQPVLQTAESQRSQGTNATGNRESFPLVPLGAALGSEHRVHGQGVLGAELGQEALQEEGHPLQAETVPLENSRAPGRQRQLSLRGSCTKFFQTH